MKALILLFLTIIICSCNSPTRKQENKVLNVLKLKNIKSNVKEIVETQTFGFDPSQKGYYQDDNGVTRYKFNKKGNLLTFGKIQGRITNLAIYSYNQIITFDKNGQIISIRTKSKSGDVSGLMEFVYDKNGLLKEISDSSPNGTNQIMNTIRRTFYKYNNKKECISIKTMDTSGKLLDISYLFYDKNGNEIKSVSKHKIVLDVPKYYMQIKKYEYDRRGNWIKKSEYSGINWYSETDVNGKFIENYEKVETLKSESTRKIIYY